MTKDELEKSLLALTGEADVESALKALKEAVSLLEQLKHVGMVCMLVGPSGVLQTLLSERFMHDSDGIATLQRGLLDLQSGLVDRQRSLSERAHQNEQKLTEKGAE